MKRFTKRSAKRRKKLVFGDTQPNIGIFGAGWEAWPALGYNTSQKAVQDDLQLFLDQGYPLRWGVIGSGFWERHGTTTTFGRWNYSKYPDPQGMIDWFHDNNLKILFRVTYKLFSLPP